jgi:Tol biopolymer transport system component
LWIADDDIAAIRLGAPPFTAADIEFVLPHPLGYVDYSWSNNDGMPAYLKLNYDSAGNNVSRTLWVRALDPPSDVPIYTRTNAEGAISSGGSSSYFQCSPDGSRIAFNTHNSSSYGGVWTIKPDGTGLLKVKTNSGTMSYSSRGWSPNSTELLLETIKARIGDWYYNIARMPAGGGTLTTLANDVPQTLGKTAVGWVPLSP